MNDVKKQEIYRVPLAAAYKYSLFNSDRHPTTYADEGYLCEENEYDPRGLILSNVKYDENGHAKEKIIYRYDQQSRLVHKEEIYHHAGSAIKTEYIWDKENEIQKIFHGKDLYQIIEQKVDKEGRVREHAVYDEEHNLLEQELKDFQGKQLYYQDAKREMTAEYNEQGNPVRVVRKQGEVSQQQRYSYANEKLSKVEYFQDNEKTETQLHSYDAAGRLASISIFHGDQLTAEIHHTYDSQGVLKEKTERDYKEGEARVLWTEEYDPHGRLLLQSNLQEPQDVYTVHEWEYDQQGRTIRYVITHSQQYSGKEQAGRPDSSLKEMVYNSNGLLEELLLSNMHGENDNAYFFCEYSYWDRSE